MNLGQYGNRPAGPRPQSFQPGGYLTPVSGTPVITADATAISTVFYTPDQHNALPIFCVGAAEARSFEETALPLTGLLANNIYDLLAYNDGGKARFCWSPAWQVATAGAGARGTGLGTPELTRRDGLLVNANPILVSMAGQGRAIAAGAGTYLGSVSIGSVAGQVNCHRSYGQSRRWDIWNAYNQKPITVKVGDATSSWTYGTNVFRPSRNITANSFVSFCGLPASVKSAFNQNADAGFGGGTTDARMVSRIGIGLNNTTSPSGFSGKAGFNLGSGSLIAPTVRMDLRAQINTSPMLGTNMFTALESVLELANVSANFYGAESEMLLTGTWLG